MSVILGFHLLLDPPAPIHLGIGIENGIVTEIEIGRGRGIEIGVHDKLLDLAVGTAEGEVEGAGEEVVIARGLGHLVNLVNGV